LDQDKVIFRRVYDEALANQMFEGFIGALNSFASQMSEKGLSNFDLGYRSFHIKRSGRFMFVVNCDKKAKSKDVQKELESIATRFVDRYSPVFFETWNGDDSVFQDFLKAIDDSLDSVITKMKDSLW
jgi:hypothetical protein